MYKLIYLCIYVFISLFIFIHLFNWVNLFHLLIYSSTYLCACVCIPSFSHLFIHLCFYVSSFASMYLLLPSRVCFFLFIHSLMYFLNHSFIYWFTYSCDYAFVYLCISLFIYLFLWKWRWNSGLQNEQQYLLQPFLLVCLLRCGPVHYLPVYNHSTISLFVSLFSSKAGESPWSLDGRKGK
jgi:hypothetical protein